MNIGIGGAGGKLASLASSGECAVVNVSELELSKLEAKNKLLAVTHSARGQLRGSGKNPSIGREAFVSINEELKNLIKGNLFEFFHFHSIMDGVYSPIPQFTQCGASRGYVGISATGDIYPCHGLINIDEYKLGNAFDVRYCPWP